MTDAELPETRRPPADHDVRRRFIDDLDTSFFLEAGAGSGKTSVIVDRVVNLVRNGRSLSEIVAISFTEKAAAELRERIRKELAAAGLHDALRDVDAAPIQTIHAFTASILREHALDFCLDPDFRVLDQLQADLRFAQSWRSWLWSDQSSHATQSALQRALDHGLELNHLQLAAEQLSRNRDLDADHPSPDDANHTELDDHRERDAALLDVVHGLRQFIDDDAERRRGEGALTYDDLLLEARNLLIESQKARLALRDRYRTILIDEFQDTDPLQAQIALLLAAEPDTDDWTQAKPGPGRLVIAGDPKQSIYRFRRADIDVYEQVRDIFANSPETSAIANLSVNFRARPQLCAWHNRVLSRILEPVPDAPRAQARWEKTVPHRTTAGPAVAVIPSNRQFKTVPEARKDEATLIANLITHWQEPDAKLGALTSDDGHSRTPKYRDVAILVRTRAGADLYTAALDRAGIPYHFDSGQNFYQQPEIRAIAHLLQALDDPTDQTAAIAVLKSPLAAASDAELFELRTALDGQPVTINPQSLPDDYDGRLREPIASLAELRRDLHRFLLPELIDHVVRASGLLEAQAVVSRAASMHQRQSNLRMLVQRAAQFADNNNHSLRPFVRWLSQRGVRSLPESESATTEADDDAVRILTIHQAKGLEFPIVIIPKLQDQPWSAADVIIDRPNDRLEFQLGDARAPFRTPGYVAARRRDRIYADAEARRMLYVAATRAQDWLILPSFPADSLQNRDSFHTYLDDAEPDWLSHNLDETRLVVSPRSFDTPPSPSPTLREPPYEELKERWHEHHQAALDGGRRDVQSVTPSQLSKGRELELQSDTDDSELEPMTFAKRDGPETDALTFGTAVHNALHEADLNDLDLTYRRTARLCHRSLIPSEPVFKHVERAFRSDLLQRAARSEQVYRELPLVSIEPDDDHTTITEGVADLLFSDPAGWVLVDYKTDSNIPTEPPAHYYRQVQEYVSLLDNANVQVSEAYLLFTATGESMPVPLNDDSAP